MKTGAVVDGKGRPMSPELLLEMMGKMQTEFDSAGKPTSTFVIHPDMLPSVKAAAEQIENDPELKRRHEQLLREQREAWAARESNRKLVDYLGTHLINASVESEMRRAGASRESSSHDVHI